MASELGKGQPILLTLMFRQWKSVTILTPPLAFLMKRLGAVQSVGLLLSSMIPERRRSAMYDSASFWILKSNGLVVILLTGFAPGLTEIETGSTSATTPSTMTSVNASW